MAKSNDVYALAAAALSGNKIGIETACKVISSKERESSTLKKQIDRLLSRSVSQFTLDGNLTPSELKGLVLHTESLKSLSDVALSLETASKLSKFMKERKHIDALLDFNLTASNKLLLSGPPGNGKTSLAEAIANELKLPLFVLDFSGVISSHLGQTSSNIAKVFRNVSKMPCILFIDEMETILSERAGKNNRTDVGEMSRIVSSLLLEIDRLPNHVVLLGATNHIEMLDSAVVRRFNDLLELNAPDSEIKIKWFNCFVDKYPNIPIKELIGDVNEHDFKSISDMEAGVLALCKEWALSQV